jgi:hyperosmotically inducible protein
MKSIFLTGFLTAALMVAGAATGAAGNAPKSDAEIEKAVTHELRMYPRYTIWDDVNFRVANGQVELFGAVSQPFKKADMERIVSRVPGVTSLTSELKVLPLSSFDDRLRIQIARAIYGYPALSRYALGANPPIHIIVDNGHVTLTGWVNSDMDKQIAGMRASGAGLSFGAVTNNLQVEHPTAKRG